MFSHSIPFCTYVDHHYPSPPHMGKSLTQPIKTQSFLNMLAKPQLACTSISLPAIGTAQPKLVFILEIYRIFLFLVQICLLMFNTIGKDFTGLYFNFETKPTQFRIKPCDGGTFLMLFCRWWNHLQHSRIPQSFLLISP